MPLGPSLVVLEQEWRSPQGFRHFLFLGMHLVGSIKQDGYRAQAHLANGEAHIYTRRGYDWSDTFASIAKAICDFPAREVILDGEIVVLDDRGISDYHQLQGALAQRSLRIDRILCRETAKGGPIEAGATVAQEPQKSVMEQGAKRHRDP